MEKRYEIEQISFSDFFSPLFSRSKRLKNMHDTHQIIAYFSIANRRLIIQT